MIVGDNMNIPSASRMFATTRSSTINGTNTIKPISNAVISRSNFPDCNIFRRFWRSLVLKLNKES